MAGEVRSISESWIFCRGEEGYQFAPILPETAQLLYRMADGLNDEQQVFRGERGRDERFGYEGMRKLVRGLMKCAGLTGFTCHNLRDTFATLVTKESGDLKLGMALIRDKVPGVAPRYVERDLPVLLERYSPLRQIVGSLAHQEGETSKQMGESLVETGES